MNAFDCYAEAVKPSWARTRERATARAAQTRAKTAAEKALDEDETLDRLWVAGERRRRAELLAGPHSKDIRGLMQFLGTMTLSSAPALIEFVRRCTWIQEMPNEARCQVLRIVSEGIQRVCAAEGLPYPDDALWDEPPRAYQVIRDIMGVL